MMDHNLYSEEECLSELFLEQLQPHFLFNMLGIMRIMIKSKPELSYDLLYDFSKYLRVTLQGIQQQDIRPFEEELEAAVTYAKLSSFRFPNCFVLQQDIQCKDFELPSFTLQPLIRNAIKYGFWDKKVEGTIILRTWETEQEYIVQVSDTGCGFDINELPKEDNLENESIFSLSYIKHRIQALLQGSILLVSKKGEGTDITITIPKSRRGSE